MLHYRPHLKIHHITLMIVSTVLSSDSSEPILKISECEIEYRSSKTAIATFYLHFESKTNLIVSNLTFELEQCKAAMKDCERKTRCNLYQRNNSSNGVKCAQEIDHLTEIKSTSPLLYYIVAGSNFKVDIGRIRDLQCICREFDLSQQLNILDLSFGKANVTISGNFYDIPEVKNTYLTATPKNTLSVQKINRFDFQISTRNLCQTYGLALTVVSEPTCTNWEIKKRLTFPLNGSNASIFCQYNGIDITIRTSACDEVGVYYTVIIENENITTEFIQELTFPNKWIKLQSKTSITAFTKSCLRGCKRCEKEKEFICYSTIPKLLKNEKTSIMNIIVIPCVLGGLVLFIIFGMIFRLRHSKRNESCNSDEDKIQPRRRTESFSRMLMQKDENYAEENDPIYEKISEFHHYDKPDIS